MHPHYVGNLANVTWEWIYKHNVTIKLRTIICGPYKYSYCVGLEPAAFRRDSYIKATASRDLHVSWRSDNWYWCTIIHFYIIFTCGPDKKTGKTVVKNHYSSRAPSVASSRLHPNERHKKVADENFKALP